MMPDFTESYLSEKNLGQVVAACRYAFKELDLNVLDDHSNDSESHFLLAKEKYSFIFNPYPPSIKIHVMEDGDETQMTINVEIFRDAIGPWLKNRCITLANNFINIVKVAEDSIAIKVESNSIPVNSTLNQVGSISEADKHISDADALKKFAELKDQGIITEEEFNAKKKQIIGF